MRDFMTTPCVKFVYHSLFYFLFLILFSYVLLCDFYLINRSPDSTTSLGVYISVPEIVLIIWVFTFAVDKVREFALNERKVLSARLKDYFLGSQNIFDALAICSFALAEILRFIPDQNCYLAARVILCFNILLWFGRSMYVYKILRSVGPKLYMIRRMLSQLMYFLLIVVMFMFAFGVSTQALMYHNQALNADLLKNVFLPAYFIIGGEYYTYNYMIFRKLKQDFAGNQKVYRQYFKKSRYI
jgi:transient receptor potential cation channel subfamily M protein 7